MYSLPELYDTHKYLQQIADQKITACFEECTFHGDAFCDDDLSELCGLYMSENDWHSPTDLQAAVQIYSNLRETLYQDLN